MGWTDYNGVQIVDDPTGQGGIYLNENFEFLADTILASAMQARLTLASGTPVPSSDLTNQSTLYLTPFRGNKIGLYDPGSAHWVVHELSSEISLSSSGLSTDANYDLFVYDNAGSLALEEIVWSSSAAGASSRATSLASLDGVLVKSGDTGKRYVGTVRTVDDSGAKFSDSQSLRFVWNWYNQVQRSMYVEESASHSYTTAAWRAWNADNSLRIQFVRGQPGLAPYRLSANIEGSGGWIGFGVNANNSSIGSTLRNDNASAIRVSVGFEVYRFATGYNYVQVIEYGGAGYTSDVAQIAGILLA